MVEKIMEAGKGVYFLWGLGLLGLLLKIITNVYLRGMVKASENMATTGKKSLRAIRQKYENGRSLGINRINGQAFVEKNVRGLRLGPFPLEAWRHSGQAMCSLICMTVGAAFLYYDVSWRGSPEMTGFLINAGIVFAFLVFVENIFLITNKIEILKANIRDYLDNLTPIRERGISQREKIVERQIKTPTAEKQVKSPPMEEIALTEEEIKGLIDNETEKEQVKSCYHERDSNQDLLDSFLKEFFS